MPIRRRAGRPHRPGSFRFTHDLDVAAPPERVQSVLVDLEHYPDWWPQVRAVASLGPDAALVVCRSVLPYDLELTLEAVRRDPLHLEVRISGPIDGFARWTLAPIAPGTTTGTRMAYCQEVDTRGTLRWASYLLRPVLRWNHAVMMRGFDRGLSAALAGRTPERPS